MNELKTLLLSALKRTAKTALLVMRIVIPMYILADVLNYFNLLTPISVVFKPFTSLLNLPPEMALGITAGFFFFPHATVAFAMALNLTAQQLTTVGSFMVICHALTIETPVLRKVGIRSVFQLVIRIGFGLLAGLIVAHLPSSFFGDGVIIAPFVQEETQTLVALITTSLLNALNLFGRILLIVGSISILLELINRIPAVKNGDSRYKAVVPISTGLVLGVTYGAGILIAEAEKGEISKPSMAIMAAFLSIAHAVIEDTLIFASVGANGGIILGLRLAFGLLVALITYFFIKLGKDGWIYYKEATL